MTNGTKILIVIVIVATIITGSIVIENKRYEKVKDENKQKENTSDIFDVLSENKEDNNLENNTVVENNIIENTESKNKILNTTVEEQKVSGREEQESKEENIGVNNKETAIELAKKEWGIDVDSYDYEVQPQSEGTYEVTVRNKTGNRNSVAIYVVNIITGAVTER